MSDESHPTTSSPLEFARPTGLPPSMGKCSSSLKTLVPDAVRDDFDALARSLGMDSARLLRMLVLTRVYGADRVRMMAAQEVDMAAGTGPQRDREGAQS